MTNSEINNLAYSIAIDKWNQKKSELEKLIIAWWKYAASCSDDYYNTFDDKKESYRNRFMRAYYEYTGMIILYDEIYGGIECHDFKEKNNLCDLMN